MHIHIYIFCLYPYEYLSIKYMICSYAIRRKTKKILIIFSSLYFVMKMRNDSFTNLAKLHASMEMAELHASSGK